MRDFKPDLSFEVIEFVVRRVLICVCGAHRSRIKSPCRCCLSLWRRRACASVRNQCKICPIQYPPCADSMVQAARPRSTLQVRVNTALCTRCAEQRLTRACRSACRRHAGRQGARSGPHDRDCAVRCRHAVCKQDLQPKLPAIARPPRACVRPATTSGRDCPWSHTLSCVRSWLDSTAKRPAPFDSLAARLPGLMVKP